MKIMTGSLIVIDGVDSSGKQTQVEQLCQKLEAEGRKVKRISFPNYDSSSSALVKMYLNGELGTDAEVLDPYAISTFYAADRYISYVTDWKKDLEEGTIVVADRYVSSNMIHQAAKIHDPEAKKAFLDWLDDFEFNIYKLPRPDAVIFLNMPVEFGSKLMAERKNKITGEDKKDIHENNIKYLFDSYNNAMGIANAYDWQIVNCVKDNAVRSIEDISSEIFDLVKEKF